jgi:thioredoxin 1
LSEKVRKLTGQNWETEVTASPEPVLVDFWAEWCAPCRKVAPLIDALAEEYSGRLKVGKVNVDDDPELAGRFGIMSIPTLLVFRGGQVAEQRVGALPREELKRLVESHTHSA